MTMVLFNIKKINALIVLIIMTLIVGCGGQGEYTKFKGSGIFAEKCINGVVYYFQGHGMAPAFKPDGSLYTCNNNKEQQYE